MPMDSVVARETWERYAWMRDRGHLDFIRKADKCRDFTVGLQWDPADEAKLRAAGRPALTINKTLGTVKTLAGQQIQARTDVVFRPAAGGSPETADALTAVWAQISQNNQLPWVRSGVFLDGQITGRGFYDARLDFDDNLRGEVRITHLNPKNVLIDPDADSYDPDRWSDVIVTRWVNPDQIAALYGKEQADFLRAKGASAWSNGSDSLDMYRDSFAGDYLAAEFAGSSTDASALDRNIRVIDRQWKKLDRVEHFVDLSTGDTRPVPRGWDRERIAALLEKTGGRVSVIRKLQQRIRWTVAADDVVLKDDWSPYDHFTVVGYFPFFWHGRTVGTVENLIGPQELLNKATSQELHVINTSANSGWMVQEGSLHGIEPEELEERGAATGLVLTYRKGAEPPQKIQPNQIPSGLERMTYKAEESIKTISLVSDSMQGFDREDVAAKAIAYKQQAGSLSTGLDMDMLTRTDWILARNVLSIVQRYYDEERVIMITGNDPSRVGQSVTVNQPDPATGQILNDLTVGEYGIIVDNVPQRASLEDSQFEQARALRELGVKLPDSVLIENSRLLRRREIISQIEAENSSEAAQTEKRLKEEAATAEIEFKRAQAEKTRVDAELSRARSEKAYADAAEAAAGEDPNKDTAAMQLEIERERAVAELEIKRAELELKREEMESRIALEREKLAADEAARDYERRAAEESVHAKSLRSEAAGTKSFAELSAGDSGETHKEPS